MGNKDNRKQDNLLAADEVKNLLENPVQESNAVMSVVHSTVISQERLPMLEVIFDRFIKGFATALRNISSDDVSITFQNISYIRFRDFMDKMTGHPLIGIAKAPQLSDSLLLIVDQKMIFSCIDMLLGGTSDNTQQSNDHVYTTIERNLIRRIFSNILDELSAAFNPLIAMSLTLENMETNPKFASIVRPVAPVIFVELCVQIEGRNGQLGFLIPYSALDPIRHALSDVFLGDNLGQDTIWETHVHQEICKTSLQLTAILDTLPLSLEETLKWKIGDAIPLTISEENLITVMCETQKLFAAKMGQRHGNKAIFIEGVYKNNGLDFDF